MDMFSIFGLVNEGPEGQNASQVRKRAAEVEAASRAEELSDEAKVFDKKKKKKRKTEKKEKKGRKEGEKGEKGKTGKAEKVEKNGEDSEGEDSEGKKKVKVLKDEQGEDKTC